jgi:signal recognition particle subunit SRP54
MDDKILLRMDAMIGSMTTKEREKPELLNAKRKIRVANGSGTTVQDVNKLLKMHKEMETAMKRIKKMGGLKGLAAMFGKSGGDMGAMMEGMGGAPQGGMGGNGGFPGLLGLPGGAGGIPPDLAKLLNKKK